MRQVSTSERRPAVGLGRRPKFSGQWQEGERLDCWFRCPLRRCRPAARSAAAAHVTARTAHFPIGRSQFWSGQASRTPRTARRAAQGNALPSLPVVSVSLAAPPMTSARSSARRPPDEGRVGAQQPTTEVSIAHWARVCVCEGFGTVVPEIQRWVAPPKGGLSTTLPMVPRAGGGWKVAGCRAG